MGRITFLCWRFAVLQALSVRFAAVLLAFFFFFLGVCVMCAVRVEVHAGHDVHDVHED